MTFRDLIRFITPHGMIEAHRCRFQLGRFGLPATRRHWEATVQCRYGLWPKWLRVPENALTVVDVGANEGDFIRAVVLLSQVQTMYAFEPLPSCHQQLRGALELIPEGRLFPNAVGDKAGTVAINVTRNAKLASVLKPQHDVASGYPQGEFDVSEQIEVPLVTLDKTLADTKAIDLLKVDVQGFECEVFRGGVSVLQRTRSILLEINYVAHYEAGSTFDEVYVMLKESGFRLSGISEPFGTGDLGPLWADAMFVR